LSVVKKHHKIYILRFTTKEIFDLRTEPRMTINNSKKEGELILKKKHKHANIIFSEGYHSSRHVITALFR
jgi:hypothetical protein